jgi:hypothetical protein
LTLVLANRILAHGCPDEVKFHQAKELP